MCTSTTSPKEAHSSVTSLVTSRYSWSSWRASEVTSPRRTSTVLTKPVDASRYCACSTSLAFSSWPLRRGVRSTLMVLLRSPPCTSLASFPSAPPPPVASSGTDANPLPGPSPPPPVSAFFFLASSKPGANSRRSTRKVKCNRSPSWPLTAPPLAERGLLPCLACLGKETSTSPSSCCSTTTPTVPEGTSSSLPFQHTSSPGLNFAPRSCAPCSSPCPCCRSTTSITGRSSLSSACFRSLTLRVPGRCQVSAPIESAKLMVGWSPSARPAPEASTLSPWRSPAAWAGL
mmetsp:Transcript_58975/g.133527  ORF Transcript_58975/g.133527 Transcript_58975/m.133527 type:complete len:288 (+) Transcript_58975:493-1356(+)